MVEVDVLPTYNVSSAVKSVVEAPPFRNDRPLTVRVPPTVSVVGLNDPAVSVPLTFKFVVVALLVVALSAVKFCSVDEPVTKRLAKVARPVEVTVVRLVFPVMLVIPVTDNDPSSSVAWVIANLPEKVEVELLPSTFKKPCSDEVPVVFP